VGRTRKSLALILILIVGISTLTELFATIPLGRAQSGTSESGTISSDTIWTQANSPYSLTGNVYVSNLTTLTIAAGVTVNLNTFSINVNGTLKAQGNDANNIVLNSNPNPNNYPRGEVVTAINLQYGSYGSILDTILNTVSVYSQNSIIFNNNTYNGLASQDAWSTVSIINIRGSSAISNSAIDGEISVQSSGTASLISNNVIIGGILSGGCSSLEILNNTITGGANDSGLIGIHLINPSVQAVISDNYISNFKESCITIDNNASAIIQRNMIQNGLGRVQFFHPFGIEVISSDPIIQDNTITGNLIGLDVYNSLIPPSTDSHPTIKNNNIYNNTEYNIYLGFPDGYWYAKGSASQAGNVEASSNWWGTSDTQIINQTIYDFKNQANLGFVNFLPYLTSLNPQATPDPNGPIPTLTESPSPAPLATTTSSTSPTIAPTPSPTVPEFPMLLIPTLFILIVAAGLLVYFKSTNAKNP
jgi:hypothetical protein